MELGHAALLLQLLRATLGRVALLGLLVAVAVGTLALGTDVLLLLVAAEGLPRLPLLGSAGVILAMLLGSPTLGCLAFVGKQALGTLRLSTLGILRGGTSLRVLARLDAETFGALHVAALPLIALPGDSRGFLALRTQRVFLLSYRAFLVSAIAAGIVGLAMLCITP